MTDPAQGDASGEGGPSLREQSLAAATEDEIDAYVSRVIGVDTQDNGTNVTCRSGDLRVRVFVALNGDLEVILPRRRALLVRAKEVGLLQSVLSCLDCPIKRGPEIVVDFPDDLPVLPGSSAHFPISAICDANGDVRINLPGRTSLLVHSPEMGLIRSALASLDRQPKSIAAPRSDALLSIAESDRNA